MGSFKLDPMMKRVQKSFDNGSISSSERVSLDSMRKRDEAFAQKLQEGGLSKLESMAVSLRRKRYEATVALFEKTNLPMSAKDESSAAGVRAYDDQKSRKQLGDLSAGIRNGKIDKGEFQVLHTYGKGIEADRAKLAKDGFTASERRTIDARQQRYQELITKFTNTSGTVKADENAPSAKLYDKLKPKETKSSGTSSGFMGGIMNTMNSSQAGGMFGASMPHMELSQANGEAYGKAAAQRGGDIYGDERARVRDHFNKENQIADRPKLSPVPATPTQTAKPSEPPAGKYEDLNSFQSQLAKMDKDGNGSVTKREVTNALRDPSIKGDDAKMLAAMHQGFDNFTSVPASSGRGFGQAIMSLRSEPTIAIAEFDPSKKESPEYSARLQNLNSITSRMGEVSSEAPSLYGPSGKPDPHSIKQGREGDCWLLSSVAGMKPEAIQNLIKPGKDGNYEVHFPGKPPETVSPPTEAERHTYASSNGSWINILEKGADQALERQNSDINGDLNPTAYKLLTGQGGRHIVANESLSREGWDNNGTSELQRDPKKLGATIQESFAEGRLVNAYSSQGYSDTQNNRVVSSNHAYTVTGYDQNSGMVTVRNPWGQGESADQDGKNDGVFRMSIDEFHASFPVVSISDGKPNAK